MRRTLLLLAGLLLGFAPAPFPRPTKRAAQRPIEAAYKKIHLGMTATELFEVMAPFKEVHTGHGQWRIWTDGQFDVAVTIWFNPITGMSNGVTEKSCSKSQRAR
jgi:hypothetical protein